MRHHTWGIRGAVALVNCCALGFPLAFPLERPLALRLHRFLVAALSDIGLGVGLCLSAETISRTYTLPVLLALGCLVAIAWLRLALSVQSSVSVATVRQALRSVPVSPYVVCCETTLGWGWSAPIVVVVVGLRKAPQTPACQQGFVFFHALVLLTVVAPIPMAPRCFLFVSFGPGTESSHSLLCRPRLTFHQPMCFDLPLPRRATGAA